MIWLVVVLTAVSVGLLVFGVAAGMSSGQADIVRARLEEVRSGARGHHELRERRRRRQRRERLQNLMEALGERLSDEQSKRSEGNRELLMYAGYRSANAPAIFLGTRLTLALSLVALTLFGSAFLPGPATDSALVVGFAGVLGWMLPFFYVRRKKDARQNELKRALPDALDLLVVCVEAGLGLNQALMRVSDEMDRISTELADELTLVSLQIRAGTPRGEALQNLAERTGLSEVRALVGVLVQTDRFGTSVGQALRVHSENLRDKRRQAAEEEAAKLSIKMLFPLIFFIFPAIFVVLLGPAIFEFSAIFGNI